MFATVAGSLLCVTAGIWQWQRGAHKQALERQLVRAASETPLELGAHTQPAAMAGVAARVRGAYEPGRQILLDGQAQGDTPGYHVWTPLRMAAGGLVIVNRGWIPAMRDRSSLPPLPAPAGSVELLGIWRELPRPGLRLGAPQCLPGNVVGWPRMALYPTAADLQCYYGEPVLDGELLLDPAAAGGFARQWQASFGAVPPQRNFAYSVQWFAFAVLALVLFVKLNLKPAP